MTVTTAIPEWLSRLIESALAVDGQPPFSDQSLVEFSRGERRLVEFRPSNVGPDSAPLGAALVSETECELVVAPDARGRGHGTALAAEVLSTLPAIEFAWAHGDHPGSRALASRHGFEPVRTLLQLRAVEQKRAPISALSRDPSAEGRPGPRNRRDDGPELTAFRPGIDDAEWLALNALAFADHPEQGKLAQRDLDDRIGQPWFNADDFLLLREADSAELIAFCWMKVEDDVGEFYAVGVDPRRHGRGLGRVLMEAGLARLAEQGIRTAALYVEADNAPALALYRRFGFEQHTIDVRYQRQRR